MPLDWKEIANRARTFSKDWKHVEREDADAKSFWDEFFEVFGIKRRKVATFEKRVKKIDQKDGYIDLLWKGTLLIEHKSRGKDLLKAFNQAQDFVSVVKGISPYLVEGGDFVLSKRYRMSTNCFSRMNIEVVANCDHLVLYASIRSQFPTLDRGNL